mgnify:CR=1 FL=1
MEIIGIVLGIIAIGLTLYFRKDQKITNEMVEFDIDQSRTAYQALMKDFTNYQVSEKRLQEKSVARMEIRHDNIARSIKKNEEYISYMKKSLPEQIRDVIGHIEFARPLDKK